VANCPQEKGFFFPSATAAIPRGDLTAATIFLLIKDSPEDCRTLEQPSRVSSGLRLYAFLLIKNFFTY
jgi:hypothetical protein